MARGFSKAIITGNIVRDPELRATSGGTQVCSFSVAVIVVEDFNFIGGNNSDGSSSRVTSNSSNNESSDIIPDDIPDEPIDLSEVPF